MIKPQVIRLVRKEFRLNNKVLVITFFLIINNLSYGLFFLIQLMITCVSYGLGKKNGHIKKCYKTYFIK